MRTSHEAPTALNPSLQPEKLVILGRSNSNFHFAVKFRPSLELVTFEAISNEVFSPVEKRYDDERNIDVAFYAAVLFGFKRDSQNRVASGYFREQARKIGYSLYQNKVIDLGEIAERRRRAP